MIVPKINPRTSVDEEFIDECFIRLFNREPPYHIHRNGQPYKIASYKPENDESYFGGLIRISYAVYRKIR